MKTFQFILLACFLSTGLFAQDPIIYSDNPKAWLIQTKSSAYQLKLSDKNELIPVFYGAKEAGQNWIAENRTRHNGPYVLYETPVRGKYADKTPLLEVVFQDGTRDIALEFVSYEIIQLNKRPCLKLVQRDQYYPLQITSYIRVLSEYDIIEKWMEIKNTDKKQVIKVENMQSASFSLPADQYYLNQHSGQWLREFQLQKAQLTTGVKTIQSKDFYSFENTPWFAVTNTKDDDLQNASVYYGQVHYSGNWRIDFASTHSNHLQITGGINFWDTSLDLKPNETITSPIMSMGFTKDGTDQAARNTSAYIRNEILPSKMAQVTRPVLYNSWYATGMNVNETHQLALAKVAKEMGIELFVIDDGWFPGRKNDHGGLGDWVVDKEKFPNGLNPMIEKINALGLDFGIWVEPEMVNPNSDLYRLHPDWVLHFANRDRTEWRNQLTLNLAREDVYQYLLKSMSDLLAHHNIKFIKWDRNRGITQPGWPSAPIGVQREVRVKYIQNLNRLVSELRNKFPHVMFENCSSGGGRPDLGMLSLMDQTWASDNTDPVDRLFIQYGYLSAYPSNTMVCWTNSHFNYQLKHELDFVFDVAMQGVLGIGQDITKWNDQEKVIASRKISQYKAYRKYTQNGILYRLSSPFTSNRVALQYTIDNGNSSLLMCYNLGQSMEGSNEQMRQSQNIKLQGLQPDRLYNLTVGKESKSFTGSFLMEIGIQWPVRGAYKSEIIELK